MKKKLSMAGQPLTIIPISRPGRKDVLVTTTFPILGSESTRSLRAHIDRVEAEYDQELWKKNTSKYRKTGHG